jgi:hypothetical protein
MQLLVERVRARSTRFDRVAIERAHDVGFVEAMQKFVHRAHDVGMRIERPARKTDIRRLDLRESASSNLLRPQIDAYRQPAAQRSYRR